MTLLPNVEILDLPPCWREVVAEPATSSHEIIKFTINQANDHTQLGFVSLRKLRELRMIRPISWGWEDEKMRAEEVVPFLALRTLQTYCAHGHYAPTSFSASDSQVSLTDQYEK